LARFQQHQNIAAWRETEAREASAIYELWHESDICLREMPVSIYAP
jgi:hypothetical protein